MITDVIWSCTTVFQGADIYPDLVFTANAAIIKDKKAYVANFKYPERQGERFFYEKWFRDNGYEIVNDKNIICEGDYCFFYFSSF